MKIGTVVAAAGILAAFGVVYVGMERAERAADEEAAANMAAPLPVGFEAAAEADYERANAFRREAANRPQQTDPGYENLTPGR